MTEHYFTISGPKPGPFTIALHTLSGSVSLRAIPIAEAPNGLRFCFIATPHARPINYLLEKNQPIVFFNVTPRKFR